LWTLVQSWLPARVPSLVGLGAALLALVTALLILLSVIAHATFQMLVGRALSHTPAPGVVNLGIFGATSSVLETGVEGRQQAVAVLAGPLGSGVLAIIFSLLSNALGVSNPAIAAVCAALALANGFLALFNLIPAVPLDGAAALRAALPEAAGFTQLLTTLLAIVLIIWGAWVGFVGQDIDLALWLIFLGWAVRELATGVSRRQTLRAGMSTVYAGEMMERDYPTVQASDTLDQIMHSSRLRSLNQVPVLDGDTLVGILPIDIVEETLQGTWKTTTARDKMIGKLGMKSATPRTTLLDALSLLPEAGSSTAEGSAAASSATRQLILPVADKQQLVGVLTSERLSGFAGLEQTFGMNTAPEAEPPSPRALALTLVGLLIVAFIAAVTIKPEVVGSAVQNEALLPTPTAEPAVSGADVRFLWPEKVTPDLRLDAKASQGSSPAQAQGGGDWSYNLAYHDSNRSFRLIGGKNATIPTVGGTVKKITIHDNPARLNSNIDRISVRWGEGGGEVAVIAQGMSAQEVISVANGTIPLEAKEWSARLADAGGQSAATPTSAPAAVQATPINLPLPTAVPTVGAAEVRYMFPATLAPDLKLSKAQSHADAAAIVNAGGSWGYSLVYHDSSRSFRLRGGPELTLAGAGGAISEVQVHGNPARLEVNGDRISLQWGEGGGVVTIFAQGMSKDEVISIASGTSPLTPDQFITRMQQ